MRQLLCVAKFPSQCWVTSPNVLTRGHNLWAQGSVLPVRRRARAFTHGLLLCVSWLAGSGCIVLCCPTAFVDCCIEPRTLMLAKIVNDFGMDWDYGVEL